MSDIDILSISTYEEFLAFKEKISEKTDLKSFSFSKLSFDILDDILSIEKKLSQEPFFYWFHREIELTPEDNLFLERLVEKEGLKLQFFGEEDLKAKFIIPILNRVDFEIDEIRDFYEAKLSYTNEKFSLSGTVDFVVGKGLDRVKTPIFFIQEFKKGKDFSDPEPQLIGELISGLEISNLQTIKGAFIIGSIWNFVILEKMGENSYQYFVSKSFDSSDLEKLKLIYRNLLFVKKEIIEIIESEK